MNYRIVQSLGQRMMRVAEQNASLAQQGLEPDEKFVRLQREYIDGMRTLKEINIEFQRYCKS